MTKARHVSGPSLAAGCLVAFASAAHAQTEAPAARPVPVMRDVMMGMADAPVSVVEYASTTCSACQHFHLEVLPRLKARYILTGEVNFVLRDHPTPPVPIAIAGSALARCAGADRYYTVINDLFSRQTETLAAVRAGEAQSQILKIGAAHGMNATDVQSCLTNPDIKAYIQKQIDDAPEVIATPTIYINGRPVAEPTFAALSRAIDFELAALAVPPPPPGIPVLPTPEPKTGAAGLALVQPPHR